MEAVLGTSYYDICSRAPQVRPGIHQNRLGEGSFWAEGNSNKLGEAGDFTTYLLLGTTL